MPRRITKKRNSPETCPPVLPTRRILRRTTLAKTSQNKSNNDETSGTRRTRSRQADLELIRKYIPTDKQNSSVTIAKVSRKSNSKVPVYKSIPQEDSTKDGSGIYDFKFDVNDSKEKMTKKKKKKVVKKNAAKKLQRGIWLKTNMPQKTALGKISAAVPTKEKSKKSVRIAENKASVIRTEEPQAKNIENVAKPSDTNKENLEPVASLAAENLTTNQTGSKHSEKPTVTSVENLSKRVILKDKSVASNSGDFMPFRPTNIFNNISILQEKNTPNNSLFEKSFSPISKSLATFDPGSPWRAPPLFTFSQVRNVFQSTPQNNKLDISYGRLARAAKNDSKNVIRARDSMQKNNENVQNLNNKNLENLPMEKSFNIVHQKKKSPSQRRFGTEITNLDHSNQINNTIGDSSERIIIEAETPLSNIPNQSIDVTVSTNAYNASKFDEFEDKENTALNYQTPRRVPKKGVKKHSGRSPLKPVNNVQNIQQKTNVEPVKKTLKLDMKPITSPIVEPIPVSHKETVPGPSENPVPGPSKKPVPSPSKEPVPGPSEESVPGPSNEPIPGPSGLQNLKKTSVKQRVLRQSNLNNFLNLKNMPESTTIKTRHGIFDDPDSPPVSGKPSKKLVGSESEIKTAFGFNEDDSDENMPPTNSNNSVERKKEGRIPLRAITENRNIKSFAPSRLSIGQLRNEFLVRNAKKEQKEKENKEVENVEESQGENIKSNKSPVKRKNRLVDITNFSDTFDVLSETELSESTSNVPLFADLEPSHFTKPPRHSYKRKRALKHSFSDESSSEEDEIPEPEVKRKKGKLNKQDEKKLQEWINSINQSFEEVDQYDLLVE